MSILSGRKLLALDVETTGWDTASDHGIIEIAWVEVDDAHLGATWSTLVGPARPIAADAAHVHGIAEAELDGAPEPAAFASELRAACDGRTLVFHNAGYDLPRIGLMLASCGLRPLVQPVVDTLGLARGLDGSGENALGALVQRLGLRTTPTHRALDDARATAEVLLALAPRWERERGIASLDALAAASQDVLRIGSRRLPPTEWRLDAAAVRA